MQHAVISDGVVVNVILLAEGAEIDAHTVPIDGVPGVGIGWTFDGKEFAPPVLPNR